MIRLVLQVACYECGEIEEIEFDPEYAVPDSIPENLVEDGWAERDGEHYCPWCSCDHHWVNRRATQQCIRCGKYQLRPVESVDLLQAVGDE